MVRSFMFAAIVLVTALAASGQQLNGPTASLVINGHAGALFPIPVPLSTPTIVTFDTVGQPGTPYATLVGNLVSPGLFTGSAGWFNLGANAFVFLDGFNPTTSADATATIAANGHGLIAFSLGIPGLDLGVQGLVVDPTAAIGIRLTGTSRLTTAPSNTTVVPFTADDQALFVPLPQPVPFAGTSWSGIWVSSNGFVTFGAPDASAQPSAAAMNAGPPRVALAWRDLDPRITGRVEVLQTPVATTVKYIAVPIRDGLAGPFLPQTLDGSIRFDAAGVTLHLDGTAPGEQLVGVSQGTAAIPAVSRDFSLESPITSSPTEPVFEMFPASGTYDLLGADVVYVPGGPNQYVLDVPVIPLSVTELYPAAGPSTGLASLVLEGTGFVAGATVTVGGVPVIQLDPQGRERIHVITPPGPLGPADVVVTLPDGRTTTVPGGYEYVVPAASGQTLPFFAGASLEVPFENGFVYPHFGVYHQSVWINANGCLTFDGPDGDVAPAAAKMLADPPRHAMLWHDWQPGGASQVLVYNTAFFFTVAFVDVVPAGGGAPVTFATTLTHHGGMSFGVLGALPAGPVLMGIGGGAATAPSVASDLSSFTGPSAPGQALFEVFDLANPYDLGAQTLSLTPLVDGGIAFTGALL